MGKREKLERGGIQVAVVVGTRNTSMSSDIQSDAVEEQRRFPKID